MEIVLFVIDMVGTFAFAISGAAVGVRKKLDLFGVLVLSFLTATFGGILRDVLIGAIPPAALTNWIYLAVACLAGVFAFYWHSLVEKMRNPVLIFDAAGLSVFATAGANKALAYDAAPFSAVLLGMVTGIGGGVVRDMLIGRTPVVLQSELYAVAGITGACVVVVGHRFGFDGQWSILCGAILCFGIRFVAIRYGLQLPVAKYDDRF